MGGQINRILATGGAGFLGSHLCDRLVSDGNHVIFLDNCFTGSMENIRHLIGHPHFEWVRQDVTEPFFVDCDQIYNLACPASPVWYQKNPVYTFTTCVCGALNALELARKTGARILQSSTSEVYGDPDVNPQTESYRGNVNTVGPRSCYDEGKRAAETLFHDYGRQYGVDVKIMRIFNAYGPRMSIADGRVVSNFIVQALRSEPITIYGDGSQTRSFCYVDDMIEGMVRLMNSGKGFTGPVNIGNPFEFTIRGLAELVVRLAGSASAFLYEKLPVDDPVQRRPDIRLAREKLGWEPSVQLEEGLMRTIAYFRMALGM